MPAWIEVGSKVTASAATACLAVFTNSTTGPSVTLRGACTFNGNRS